MTVGIAAVCAERRAIVLMADTRLTLGDGMVTDAVVPKKRGLIQSTGKDRSGWQLLFAGNTATMEAVLEGARLATEQLEGTKIAPTTLLTHLSRSFQDAWGDEYEGSILKPRLLDRGSFRQRPTEMANLSESIVEEIESEAAQRKEPFGVDFILCGFDGRDDLPVLATIRDGEIEPEMMMGFAAVGEAEGVSIARLIFNRMRPSDSLAHALYKVFDAKCHAELFGSVGADTQAWVMILGRAQPIEVPFEVTQALTAMFAYANVGPFVDRGPILQAPIETVREFAARVTDAAGPPLPATKSSATNVSSRPSSQSQSDERRKGSQPS